MHEKEAGETKEGGTNARSYIQVRVQRVLYANRPDVRFYPIPSSETYPRVQVNLRV